MNKMFKRTLALCMVILMTATSIMPQSVSASEIVQVVEHLSDQDAADENENSSEASSEEATTETEVKATEEATTEGMTAAEETTTEAESQKEEATTEEATPKTEATTTESAVAEETTTAAEATTEEEKTSEEATTEEAKKAAVSAANESSYKELKIINNPKKTEFYAGFDTKKALSLEDVEFTLTDQHDVTKSYKYRFYNSEYSYDYNPLYGNWGSIAHLLNWDDSEVDWETPGNYTVYLTCEGAKAPIEISVVECPYKSMSFELSREIYFTESNDYVSYYGGIKNIKFYAQNGKVLKTYKYMEDLEDEVVYEYGFVGQTGDTRGEEGDEDLIIDKYVSSCGGSIGAQKIFLKCNSLEATVDITIQEGNPYKVEILKNPNNLKALQGTYSSRLKLDGLAFRVYFSENEYHDFDYTKYKNNNLSTEEKKYYTYFNKAFKYYFEDNKNLNALPVGTHDLYIKVGKKEADKTIPIEVVTTVVDNFKVSLENNETKFLTRSDLNDVRDNLEFSFEYRTEKYNKIKKSYYSDSDYYKFTDMYGEPKYVLKDGSGNQIETIQWYEDLELGNYTLEVSWMGAMASVNFSVVETVISDFKITFKDDCDDILLSCKNEWGYLEEHLMVTFTYEGVEYKNIDVSVWDSERRIQLNVNKYEELAKKFRDSLSYNISNIKTPGEHDVEFSWLGSKTTAKLRFTDKLISKFEIVRMPKETTMYADRSWDIETNGAVYGITDLKGNYKEIEAYTDEWYEEMCYDASYEEDTDEVDWERPGNYNAYIHYMGLIVTIPITLIEWEKEEVGDVVESISITKMPTVTNYYGRISPDDDVECNLRGMEFVVYYKDGTSYDGIFNKSEETTVKYHGKEYYMYAYGWKNMTPGDPYSDDDEGMEDSVAYGENAVMCKVLDYTFEVPITVYEESPIVGIRCDKKPIKTNYFIDNWYADLYGSEFTLLFDDDTSKSITVNEHTYEIHYASHGTIFSILAQNVSSKNVMQVKCDGYTVEIPITTYYYEKDKAVEVKENTILTVSPVEEGEEEYRAFAFTPSKTGNYKFSIDSDWSRKIYLCDAEGSLLKKEYGEDATITYELKAGQTYYYVAEAASSWDSYQCILESEEGFFSEENITSFKVTGHPFKWYSFENPDDYTYVGGLKYEITFKNGYTYKGEIYDSHDEDAYITINPTARYNYVNVLGIPMIFQWKEYTKKRTNYYPAKTSTNRMEVSYAGYSQSIVPDFEQKTPVASVEILSHPWEDVIVDEDALYYDVRDMLFESIDQLKIKINYKDGRESEVYTCESSNDELHYYDLTVKLEQEEKRIKVTYMDVSGYVNLTGENTAISGITLKKAPAKTKYTDIHIDKLNVTDEIDLYGAEFTVTYTDGTKKDVKVTEHTANYKLENGYNVTAELKDSSLNIKCKNLTFNVAIEKTGIKELAGTNQFAFAEGNSKVQDAASFNKDMTYKIWAFTPNNEEEMTEYIFESKDAYSYLISANGALLETADKTGKITRKLYTGVTYYYAVVKNAADTADVTVTKQETQKVTELSLTVPKPVVGENLAAVEDLSTTTDGVKMKSIQWSRKNSEKDTVAESAAVYTATIVAETEEGYEFTEDSVYKVNENTVYVKSLDTKGVLTIKYTFDRTDCLVTIPKLEGFTTSVDGEGLSSDTTEDCWKTVVPYKNATPISLKYEKKQQDDSTITTLKVKANGKVLAQDEKVTDAFVYELSNVTSAVNITVQTTFATKPEEVTLTLMDGDKEYDKLAVKKGFSVSDNDKENTLPVLDSYTDENQELFFFGWYKEKDVAGNGTGERIVSKTKIENDTKVYARWGTGKFEYSHNTLLAVYTILSLDEGGVMKVQLSELAPSSARSRKATAYSAENNLEIPSHVRLEGNLEEFGTAEVTSIGSGAIQTSGFNTVTIPDTVETVEDNAFGRSSGIQSIVVPDSVQEATAGAFKTQDSTEDNKIRIVCGGETAERLQKSSNSDNTIQLSIVEVFFKDYSYTDKKLTLDESFKVTPVVKTTVGDSSTESSENVNVTLSASCEGYMSGKQNDDGSYSVKALKATEEKEEYLLTAEYAGIKKTIQLSVQKTSLQELMKDTEERFELSKLEDVAYDGKEHKLPVTVTDKKNNKVLTANTDYKVAYSDDTTNVGTVKVTVTGTGNYKGELLTSYAITGKAIEMQVKDVTFTYGQQGKVEVTTKDDVKVTYKSEDSSIATVDKTGKITGVKAGETYITVIAKGDNYIQKNIKVKVTIQKANVDMSAVTFASQTVTYDGKAHSLSVSNLPAGVSVSYNGNNQVNVGTYIVTAKFSAGDNYNAIPDMTAILTIKKAEENTPKPDPKPENTGTPNTENKPGDAANGSTTPNPDNTTTDQPAKTPLKKGYSYSDGKLKYKVVNNATDGTGTVSVVGYKAKKAKLTKVVIPASVTIQGTKYLVTDIAKNAFKGCTKLKSLTMGANIKTIGNSAFEKCTALTKVTLPTKVKTLGASVFKNCKKLKTITVKSKVLKTVGKNAFKGIHSKAVIKVPAAKLKAYQKLMKKKGQGSKVKIKK